MNGYKVFYKHKTADIMAQTPYDAQCKAKELFKAKNTYDIAVMLCEVEGKEIVHKADF